MGAWRRIISFDFCKLIILYIIFSIVPRKTSFKVKNYFSLCLVIIPGMIAKDLPVLISTNISGSYDGEIIIWNTNSEYVSKKLQQRCRLRARRPFTTASSTRVDASMRPVTSESQGMTSLFFARAKSGVVWFCDSKV